MVRDDARPERREGGNRIKAIDGKPKYEYF